MSRRRVVITGIGLTTPIGSSLAEVSAGLREDRSGVRPMESWGRIANLQTRLGAPVSSEPTGFGRARVRTMGRVSRLALWATDRALEDAELSTEALQDGRTGMSYGSTHGSTTALEEFCNKVISTADLSGLKPTDYLKFMSHTAPANLAIAYGVRGRVYTTCSACTSGSQGIGYGFEAIRDGYQDVMICGGAEELHVLHAGVFDVMYATSTRYESTPDLTPRPFDEKRDGLVVGEGAATFILEELEHAIARGATIHAEVVGFGTTCDGTHITAPRRGGMAAAMQAALDDGGRVASDVDYINAHGTATPVGDRVESLATLDVYGDSVPISSTKGFVGHTLGASGSIEAAFCIAMLRDGFLAPNRNLEKVDPACGQLDFVRTPRDHRPTLVANHNFAFAGINTALLFQTFDGRAHRAP